MNENKEFVGSYFIIFLRIFVVVGVAISIFMVIYSVVRGVPIVNFITSTPSVLFMLSFFLLMYVCFELIHHAERKKKNAAMKEEHADGGASENQQQILTKHGTSKKIGFWLGVFCGVATGGVLCWFLFGRVLYGMIFP